METEAGQIETARPQYQAVTGDGPDDILYAAYTYPAADEAAAESPGEPFGPFFCENCGTELDANVQYCGACA